MENKREPPQKKSGEKREPPKKSRNKRGELQKHREKRRRTPKKSRKKEETPQKIEKKGGEHHRILGVSVPPSPPEPIFRSRCGSFEAAEDLRGLADPEAALGLLELEVPGLHLRKKNTPAARSPAVGGRRKRGSSALPQQKKKPPQNRKNGFFSSTPTKKTPKNKPAWYISLMCFCFFQGDRQTS